MTRIRSIAMTLASAGMLCGTQSFAAVANVVTADISTQCEKVRLDKMIGGLEYPGATGASTAPCCWPSATAAAAT